MNSKTKLILLLLLGFLSVFTSCSKDDDYIDNSKNKSIGLRTMYVAPNSLGIADGLSKESAADFLDQSFWAQIDKTLRKDSVEVIFLPGIYSRAYTEKALVLRDIGYDNDNWLLLSGNENVSYPALEGLAEKSVMIDIIGCKNLRMSNFHFTGNGEIGYVLRISTTASSSSNNNIIIENCSWKDMRGVIYGATGAHNRSAPINSTTNITYKDCFFARIGIDSHSHHMYHAHNASRIKIINCHFEDCTGDYVRFRDSNDFIVINNCVFIHNNGFDTRHSPFIAVPLFNSREPVGDEYFVTNYAFSNNEFISKPGVNTNYGLYFGQWGFSPPEYSYLLTSEEGAILVSGSNEEKSELIKTNFGIDVKKIRIAKNSFTENIKNKLTLRSYPSYGAVSLGWEGAASIFDLVNKSEVPFEWEGQIGGN